MRAGCIFCGILGIVLNAPTARAELNASADLSSGQNLSGSYSYSLTLHDTGSTPVGTFWFGWIAYPTEDLLPDMPTSVSSPAGWQASISHSGYSYYGYNSDGYGIEWTATTPLMPGQSLSGFGFESPDSPDDLFASSPYYSGTPATTSVIYSGGPFSDSGFQFAANAAPVPEPMGVPLIVIALFSLYRSPRKRGR